METDSDDCACDDWGDYTRPMPYWLCQECGHESRTRAMPEDKTKFYEKVAKQGSPKCPHCKSVGFMPVGF